MGQVEVVVFPATVIGVPLDTDVADLGIRFQDRSDFFEDGDAYGADRRPCSFELDALEDDDAIFLDADRQRASIVLG